MSEVFRTPVSLRVGLVTCSLLMLIMMASVITLIVVAPPTAMGLWLVWGGLTWVMVALAWLVVSETVAALRVRLAMDDTALRLTLPSRRGHARLPRVDEVVPYPRIVAIESRSEAFRQIGAVAIQQAWSLCLDDGRRLVLGADRSLRKPLFGPAALSLARRTGIRIRDLGMVEGRAGLLATAGVRVPDWSAESMTEAAQGEQERRHALTQRILTLTTVVVTVLRGLLGR